MLAATTTTIACKLAYMGLAERIKSARKNSHLSQTQLAGVVGVSRQAVMQWETGATKSIDGVNLVRMAQALGVNPFWLATGDGHHSATLAEPHPFPREMVRAWLTMSCDSHKLLLELAKALAAANPKSERRRRAG